MSEDTISRQAVEEMLKAELPERGMWEIEGDKVKDTVCEVCVDLMQKLSKLPPVTPTERTGEWINRERCQVDEDAYEVATCSECGAEITIEYPHDNYCPSCGATMKDGDK